MRPLNPVIGVVLLDDEIRAVLLCSGHLSVDDANIVPLRSTKEDGLLDSVIRFRDHYEHSQQVKTWTLIGARPLTLVLFCFQSRSDDVVPQQRRFHASVSEQSLGDPLLLLWRYVGRQGGLAILLEPVLQPIVGTKV
jgi:hypothetical protein